MALLFFFLPKERSILMYLFSYNGPVEEFGKCIANRWVGQTYAPTEAKARSNLAYQFKKQYNKAPATKISLPGKIIFVGRRE